MSNVGGLGRPKVLVVDDEALIRLDLASSLAEAGFDVIEVSNADDAVAILTTTPAVAVMVTDVEMAGSMDGARLARVVRDRWPPVHIVVVSGYHRAAELELPERTRFFPKPYDVRRLIVAIRELMRERFA
jgi:CheY-like chemotaxis protein